MLSLITDCCVELGVKSSFASREVVKINDGAVDIIELNVANAVNKATKNRMKDFWSLRNQIMIREGKLNLTL